MSKLEELIEELCPDGIENKPFGEIATIVRGASPRPIKNYITDSQDGVSWIKIGDINTRDKYVKETKERITQEGAKKSRLVKKGDFILSNSMSFGRPFILDINGCIHDGWLSISNFENYFITDFLYHLLSSHKLQEEMKQKASFGGAVQNLNVDIVKSLILPLPPLPVQEEIARILDSFSALSTELTIELTEEFKARKKQYEYYKDELFGKDYDEMINRCLQNKVEVITLEDLGNFTRGKRFVREDIRDEGTPCIHYGDLYTYYGISAEKTKYFLDEKFSEKMRFAHKGDVVIVQAGENDMDIGIGVAWMGDEDVAVHDACYIFEHSINAKYISHYLRTSIYHLQIKKYVSTGKICSISAQGIGKAKIPVPPLPEQQHIVEILDHFDALCNDIRKRLQDEIKARQQQYEYYRDKFLTFKEKEVCADE